jgi:hypothetical protein
MPMAIKIIWDLDGLHRPLCEDSDKIPEGKTSTYIFHLSGPLFELLSN